MTDGWKTKLHSLSELNPDEGKLRRLLGDERRRFAGGSDRPSRRGRVVAGLVALGVFAAAGSLVWVGFRGGTTAPNASTSGPTTSAVVGSDEQVIGYHGVLVSVPASWAINDQTCGTPMSDTVLRDLGGVLGCLVPRPPGISTIELIDHPTGSLPTFQKADTLTNPNGVRVELGTLSDTPGMAAYIPDVDVLMVIDVVSGRQAIIDSIALADTDPNGCAMREMALDPPTSYAPPDDMRSELIPGVPSALAICHYEDNWLMSSARLTGEALHRFVDLVNGLEEGYVHAPADTYDPAQCHKGFSDGGELGSGYTLWVTGVEPSPFAMWAHVGICGDLGITNGARTGQLTPGFAKALNEPLHHGYVMPGRLIARPSSV